MADITRNDAAVKNLLASRPRIAMVGASDNPSRDSNSVFGYLQANGYHVTPVNPVTPSVHGVASVPDLRSAAKLGPIGIVDIFRAPDQVVPIVEEAISLGAKAIWFQLGVVNPTAIELAKAAGLDIVVDRCIKTEDQRLLR